MDVLKMAKKDLSNVVSISWSNSKMGKIPSVSVSPIVTCRHDCGCCDEKTCFAARMETYRTTCKAAWARNLSIFENNPESFWVQVKAVIAFSTFFRFHVGGDIPTFNYFLKVVECASEFPHCTILIFTKKYGFVNRFVKSGGVIPSNLSVLFSEWQGLDMVNPYDFPVAYVRMKNGYCAAPDTATVCGGNCSACAMCGGGCWFLKHGESVVFDEH